MLRVLRRIAGMALAVGVGLGLLSCLFGCALPREGGLFRVDTKEKAQPTEPAPVDADGPTNQNSGRAD